MKKERRIKGLSIVALLIAVVGLTIAFAAMNRILNINNTTAKVGKFNVRFVSDSSNFPSEKNYEYKYMGDSGAEGATTSVSQDSSDDPIIVDDGDAITYPIEGTLNSVVTYTLTSDGKIVLGGVSVIPEYTPNLIFHDIANYYSNGSNSDVNDLYSFASVTTIILPSTLTSFPEEVWTEFGVNFEYKNS